MNLATHSWANTNPSVVKNNLRVIGQVINSFLHQNIHNTDPTLWECDC